MTLNGHWILPQGIEEALPEQAARLECLRRNLLDLYASWGYEMVMPPFIDHIESLLTGTGRDLDLQTFKLVDQLSGRTLGLRADMTPQVARIDAHQLKNDVPTRLCYIGTVLHTRSDGFGSSRSPLQVGAELYGHAGVESDVEILDLMLQTFSTAGVKDLYLDLGNVDVYKNLAKQAGLDIEDELRLFELLQQKAVTETRQLVSSLSVDATVAGMITQLAELNGDLSILARARELLKPAGEGVLSAIDYLERVANMVSRHNDQVKLNFDLAELHGYHYHTGVVFGVFVPQLGQEVARGGRYDDIGKVFGRARPATGFSTDLKQLLSLSTCDIQVPQKILAPADEAEELQVKIEKLRAEGYCVCRFLPGQLEDTQAMGCSQKLEQINGQWQLVPIES
ncbi:MAG: ATP phosphoribosyltransferase regulatory subunit [Gammaproteobacteria bacterium]|nr:ATP phosphoribosyltransferase regulatory subunit [Gammaproteobacteria bacterium]